MDVERSSQIRVLIVKFCSPACTLQKLHYLGWIYVIVGQCCITCTCCVAIFNLLLYAGNWLLAI
jgi:hypothetical protein